MISRLISVACLTFILVSCSTVRNDAREQNEVFGADIKSETGGTSTNDASVFQRVSGQGDDPNITADAEITQFREIPAFGEEVEDAKFEPIETPNFPAGEISVLIPPQPLPDFIDTVFGELLELGYTLDPGVASRQEIVTYRSAPNISRDKLYASAQAALLPYGVAVLYDDGEVRIVLKEELLRQSPRFIRSRARASVPSNLRPIAKYVEIKSVGVGPISNILAQVFPDQNELKMFGLNQFSAMILTGLPDAVERAERIIAQMDEIRFARSRVATITVKNWELSELITVMRTQLSIEGFSVSSSSSQIASINLFPINYTGQLVIFARDFDQLNYAVETAERLDSSAKIDKEIRAYVYKAKFYEAQRLIDIIKGQASALSARSPATGSPGDLSVALPRSAGTTGLASEGSAFAANFSVDPEGNRLIYLASEEQHREISGLLRVLDTPQDEVLIDVTIAEVTLTDDTSYGLDFLMSQIGSQGYSLGYGTGGGIGLATGGLAGQYASGDYTINFSALSSNNQINVLSSPRLVVKSGTLGSIQVGTDVPIITSQAASNTQIGGNTDVLQSVQYRETGILLDIEPLVLSSDRIDIKVSQEVSSAEENANQAISSPIISNRKIETELTLQDGQSAIMGGLIENRYTRGSTGVPIAKDIPILGNLFKTEKLNSTRTMLLVMITPYVLSSREDRESSVRTLTDAMNEAFQNQTEESKTLLKPNESFKIDLD